MKTWHWISVATIALLFVQVHCADEEFEDLEVEDPPLFQAIEDGDREAFDRALQDTTLDVNAQNPLSRQTPLIVAVQRNNLPMMQELVTRGAQVNGHNNRAMTPIMYTTSADAVNYLVDQGANVNYAPALPGFTPLIFAARRGNHEAYDALIARGADTTPVVMGRTAAQHLEAALRATPVHNTPPSETNTNSNPSTPPATPPHSVAPATNTNSHANANASPTPPPTNPTTPPSNPTTSSNNPAPSTPTTTPIPPPPVAPATNANTNTNANPSTPPTNPTPPPTNPTTPPSNPTTSSNNPAPSTTTPSRQTTQVQPQNAPSSASYLAASILLFPLTFALA